jgi:hypothetical protein
LDRFARFLHDRFPDLAPIVAREIIAKASALADHPNLGHSIEGHATTGRS